METTCVVSGWVHKENGYMYMHNGILFTHQKEGNTASCDNMDKTGGHNAR